VKYQKTQNQTAALTCCNLQRTTDYVSPAQLNAGSTGTEAPLLIFPEYLFTGNKFPTKRKARTVPFGWWGEGCTGRFAEGLSNPLS